MQLLVERGRADQDASKTVRALTFDVPAGVSVLALKFDYAPRVADDAVRNMPAVEAAFELHTRRRRAGMSAAELTKHRDALGIDNRAKGLNNLLNVTLIDPKGEWRGRWDRNPSSDDGALLLGAEHASRGFLPGAIDAGRWTAAIEVHGIFGDAVNYELQITAREALTDAEKTRLAIPERDAIQTTRRMGPGWYFGEMHSHTVHSDGKWDVEELAERVHRHGADFLCLSDHNTMSGHERHGVVPLTLIRSCELTTFRGHHPVYGLQQMVPWHIDGKVQSLHDMAPKVRAQGGLVGVAHPFVPGDPLCTGCRMPPDLDPRDFDMMEIWYRRWESPGADNVAAYELWNKYWREGHRIVGVGARDVHGAEQEGPFPGEMPLTGVFAKDNNPEAILEAMRAGNVIVSGGPILEFTLDVAGKTSGLGDTTAEADHATARIRVRSLESNSELRLLHSGNVVQTVAVTKDGDHQFEVNTGAGFYRAELWGGVTPRTITNHIVIPQKGGKAS